MRLLCLRPQQVVVVLRRCVRHQVALSCEPLQAMLVRALEWLLAPVHVVHMPLHRPVSDRRPKTRDRTARPIPACCPSQQRRDGTQGTRTGTVSRRYAFENVGPGRRVSRTTCRSRGTDRRAWPCLCRRHHSGSPGVCSRRLVRVLANRRTGRREGLPVCPGTDGRTGRRSRTRGRRCGRDRQSTESSVGRCPRLDDASALVDGRCPFNRETPGTALQHVIPARRPAVGRPAVARGSWSHETAVIARVTAWLRPLPASVGRLAAPPAL